MADEDRKIWTKSLVNCEVMSVIVMQTLQITIFNLLSSLMKLCEHFRQSDVQTKMYKILVGETQWG